MFLRVFCSLICVGFLAMLLPTEGSSVAWAQTSDDSNGQDPNLGQLTLSHVTLYSSGMGWFVYEGSFESEGSYTWEIRESEVSDVLRTLNVTDSAGSWSMHIDAGQDPIRRPPTLPDTQTRGDLLMSMKGEPVRLRTRLQAVIEGRIVAVELRPEIDGELVVEREQLSILTDKGLEMVALDDVAELLPQRESFRDLLSKSLDRQRPENDEPTRTLQVNFVASEQREVAVAMLRPIPMWKSTYRIYDDTFLHRGVVENTTDDDWRDISLALVDGNPVTFRIDLAGVARAQRQQVARPVTRPEVPAPFAASALPPSAGEPDSEMARTGFGGMGGMGLGGGGYGGGMGGMGGGMGGGAEGGPFGNAAPAGRQQAVPQSAAVDRRFAIQNSASGVRAEAGKAGEAMQILFDKVTVPAGQAVVLDAKPFDVGSELLSVYQAASDDRTPLLSLELKNDSTMRLPAGPLSVFLEDTGYAGDTMLPLLSPGVERLVGFAVDDGVRVTPQPVHTEQELLKVAVDEPQRAIRVTRKKTKKESFVVDNRSGSQRRVVIDHEGPDQGFDWSDESPKGEQTEDGWRFALQVAHNERETLDLVAEQTETTTESFIAVDLTHVQHWLDQDDLVEGSDREVLENIIVQREERSQILDRLKNRQERRKELLAEIERVTRQLTGGEIPLSQPLADRYQNQLLELETELEGLDQEIRELKDKADELNQQLQPPNSGQKTKASGNTPFKSKKGNQSMDDPFDDIFK